jgi:AcrR family transcriptional regulator
MRFAAAGPSGWELQMMTVAGMTTRRGRPTAEDAREKLARVLTTALEQFSELGYRAVTMREVAEKAQVSTRTLYNRYADKLSLFVACLEMGSGGFPRLDPRPHSDLHQVLREHAVAIVRKLSQDSSVRLGMLVYREGGEFPELLKASEDNHRRHLVQPLAAYFHSSGLAMDAAAEELANLFLAMALSEWQRRVTFRYPMPSNAEIKRHASFVARLLLDGVKAATPEPAPIPAPAVAAHA